MNKLLKGGTAIMGTKIRSFEPLRPDVSLEELLPKDNYYCRLEERLNLSFAREMVALLYARDRTSPASMSTQRRPPQRSDQTGPSPW